MIPAKSEVIDLYRLLYKADHPMTLDEIASVNGMNTVYQTFAYVAYKEHLAKDKGTLDKGYQIPAGTWPDELRHKAWLWWLSGLLRTSCNTKRVSVSSPNGSPARGKAMDKLLYSANHENPPFVRKRVDEYRVVPWEPELDQVTDRHVAGMQFLQQVEVLLSEKKLASEVRNVLNLAAKAIREGGTP